MIQTDLGRYGISWKPLSSCGTGIKLNPADWASVGCTGFVRKKLCDFLSVSAATKSHRRDLKRCRIMLKQVDLIQVSSFFPSRTLLMAFVASVRALGLTAAPCSNSGWSWANTSEVVATLLLSVSNLTGTGHMTLYSVLAPQYSHLWCWFWMNSVPTNAWLKDLHSDLAPKWLRQASQWANCLEVRGVLLGCRELMITTSIREMYGSILFQGGFQRSLKQRAPLQKD